MLGMKMLNHMHLSAYVVFITMIDIALLLSFVEQDCATSCLEYRHVVFTGGHCVFCLCYGFNSKRTCSVLV